MLRQAARVRPDAVAVEAPTVAAAVTLTYAALDRGANRVAEWLAGRTGENELVAMRLPPGPVALALMHGAWRAGRPLAPLSTGWTDRELDAALEALGRPAMVVADSGDLAECLDGGGPEAVFDSWGRDPTAVRVVLCTSGTSGRPRPIRITEANLAASASAVAGRLGLRPEDRWLAALSLAHVGGLALTHRAAAIGAAVVTIPRFDAAGVAELVDGGEVSHVSLVPTMLLRLIEARDGRPAPPGLRCVLVGGAACGRPLLEQALDLGYPVSLTYGLTEATSQVATASPEHVRRKPWTVGRPLAGVEVRIGAGGPSGTRDARAGGEIVVRGPTVCRERLSEDGWLHTGDLGRIDGDGDLEVLGRISDAIVTGGVTVHPAEIEAVLADHPSVAEVAVTGIPDAEWGEVVAAVVRPGSPASPPELPELLAFCRDRLSAAKRPRALLVVAALPRNANGKVDRGRLAELWSTS